MTTTRQRKRRDRRDTATVVANKLGLAYLRERVHAAFDPLLTAAVEAALGVRSVYERDPGSGQWARVTDPDQLAALLNLPQSGVGADRMIVYTQDPDARLLEGLLALALGGPFDPEGDLVRAVAVAETGEATVLVSEGVLAQLRRGRDAGPADNPPPPPPVDPRRVH